MMIGLRQLLGFLVVLVSVLGCGDFDPPSDDEKTIKKVRIDKKIVNGERAFGHPSVVYVAGPAGSCTGSIIAPNIVLTAAHCISYRGETSPPSEVLVTSSQFGIPLERSAVTHYAMHPNWQNGHPVGADIAILFLASSLSTPALPLFTGAMQQLQGKTITAVGFGVTNGFAQTGGGDKRKTELIIDKIDLMSRYFEAVTPPGRATDTCQGDSGGPALIQIGLQSAIVGVVSGGPEGCTGLTEYASVPDNQTWLMNALQQGGMAPAPPQSPPSLPQAQAPAPGEQAPAIGQDTCIYANDNECDEPMYCTPGTDSSDCGGRPGAFGASPQAQQPAEQPGQNQGSAAPQSHLGGPNSCIYAHDNECDEPRFCLPGTDTADCRGGAGGQSEQSGFFWSNEGANQNSPQPNGAAQANQGGAGDTCVYARDNECDEPQYCWPGTDTSDCRGRQNADQPSGLNWLIPDAGQSGQSSNQSGHGDCPYANDGECDEPGICAYGTDGRDCLGF